MKTRTRAEHINRRIQKLQETQEEAEAHVDFAERIIPEAFED